MNATSSGQGLPAWMLNLPQWTRSFMARHWRRSATRHADMAGEAITNAHLHRNEARRLEALADWILPEGRGE